VNATLRKQLAARKRQIEMRLDKSNFRGGSLCGAPASFRGGSCDTRMAKKGGAKKQPFHIRLRDGGPD
jgi:hypothetical protein